MNKELEEALKTLEVLDKIISPLLEPVLAEYEDDLSDIITANYFALKQSLLKAQESNHHLRWEDLEFKEKGQEMSVLLNGKTYIIYFYKLSTQNEVNIYTKGIHIVTLNDFYEEDIQFFNDLKLERAKNNE